MELSRKRKDADSRKKEPGALERISEAVRSALHAPPLCRDVLWLDHPGQISALKQIEGVFTIPSNGIDSESFKTNDFWTSLDSMSFPVCYRAVHRREYTVHLASTPERNVNLIKYSFRMMHSTSKKVLPHQREIYFEKPLPEASSVTAYVIQRDSVVTSRSGVMTVTQPSAQLQRGLLPYITFKISVPWGVSSTPPPEKWMTCWGRSVTIDLWRLSTLQWNQIVYWICKNFRPIAIMATKFSPEGVELCVPDGMPPTYNRSTHAVSQMFQRLRCIRLEVPHELWRISSLSGDGELFHWMGGRYRGGLFLGLCQGHGVFELSPTITLDGMWEESVFLHGKMIVRDEAQRVRQIYNGPWQGTLPHGSNGRLEWFSEGGKLEKSFEGDIVQGAPSKGVWWPPEGDQALSSVVTESTALVDTAADVDDYLLPLLLPDNDPELSTSEVNK